MLRRCSIWLQRFAAILTLSLALAGVATTKPDTALAGISPAEQATNPGWEAPDAKWSTSPL